MRGIISNSKWREGLVNGVPQPPIYTTQPKFWGEKLRLGYVPELLYLCTNQSTMFSTQHKLDHIINNQEHIMATLAQLTAAITSINTALAAVGTEIASLNTTITNSIAGTDSDTLLAELNTIATGLEALVPAPPTPAPAA